jgi:hypothetical protein
MYYGCKQLLLIQRLGVTNIIRGVKYHPFFKILKLNQMKNKRIPVAKTYKLKSEKAPLSFMIPTKSSRSYSLLYFDEERNENHLKMSKMAM